MRGRKKNSLVAHRVHKRLLAHAFLPHVLQLGRVPHDLIHELRQTHGVRCRTGASRLEGAARGVGDVALVVG